MNWTAYILPALGIAIVILIMVQGWLSTKPRDPEAELQEPGLRVTWLVRVTILVRELFTGEWRNKTHGNGNVGAMASVSNGHPRVDVVAGTNPASPNLSPSVMGGSIHPESASLVAKPALEDISKPPTPDNILEIAHWLVAQNDRRMTVEEGLQEIGRVFGPDAERYMRWAKPERMWIPPEEIAVMNRQLISPHDGSAPVRESSGDSVQCGDAARTATPPRGFEHCAENNLSGGVESGHASLMIQPGDGDRARSTHQTSARHVADAGSRSNARPAQPPSASRHDTLGAEGAISKEGK